MLNADLYIAFIKYGLKLYHDGFWSFGGHKANSYGKLQKYIFLDKYNCSEEEIPAPTIEGCL